MMKTFFASPGRSSQVEIFNTNLTLSGFTDNCLVLNLIPNLVLILNENRQIVFANNAMLKYLNLRISDSILGLRPGELINCIHSDDTEAGCGTAKNCMVCGAVKSILSSQNGEIVDEECRILTKQSDAVDYKVHTAPLDLEGKRYVIFSITDISDVKRKRILERIFFHDILNTAGGIRGFAELLESASPEELGEFGTIIDSLTENLIEEIQAQRDLIAAENGELVLQFQTVNTLTVIQTVIQLYQKHQVANEKFIELAVDTQENVFATDARLLRRSLGNLLKNALEASEEGDIVTVRGVKKLNHYIFSVHNWSSIPPDLQLQIFKRSFSTKANDRGLGTYSVKLLIEKYLYGRAGFISDPMYGTTFYFILPMKPGAAKQNGGRFKV
ncbi:MAG: PAS domain-containing sensor histidine kinase [Ignavibacteriales bacterium]|nr:PAS domain-containing sensor histidine kinase [Ignavibacteriales bacterium]